MVEPGDPSRSRKQIDISPVLRVGFDDQIFVAQRRGGVSKYFVELFARLPRFGIEPVLLSTGTRNAHLIESGMVPRLPELSRPLTLATWASWRIVSQPRTTPRRLPQFDVMHHTFTKGAYLRAWTGPRVVTVFDMTPELYPSYFRRGNPHFAKRRYCELADAIISISENTAKDIYRIYSPDLAKKTHVIPFGVGEEFFATAGPTLDLPDNYLLFVGVRFGYKHFDLGLAAFAALAAEDPDLEFVVVGGGEFSKDERDAFDAAGLRSRIHHLSPPDSAMPEIYRRARAFEFPSIYEGFGLPTLESLASRTPTVLADASCSREVGGEAALYAAPGDLEDLVTKLRIALSPAERDRVRTAGPRRAAQFSWDDLAARTADLYRSLV
jgi:glycosyltransferase involved in cell wall biosynthesis